MKVDLYSKISPAAILYSDSLKGSYLRRHIAPYLPFATQMRPRSWALLEGEHWVKYHNVCLFFRDRGCQGMQKKSLRIEIEILFIQINHSLQVTLTKEFQLANVNHTILLIK